MALQSTSSVLEVRQDATQPRSGGAPTTVACCRPSLLCYPGDCEQSGVRPLKIITFLEVMQSEEKKIERII